MRSTKQERRFCGGVMEWAVHMKARSLSRSTIKRRLTALRSFQRFIAPLELHDATTELVEEWLGSLTSPRTRAAYRSDLRAYYQWASRRRIVHHDPTSDLGTMHLPKSLPRPLDEDDLRAVVATAPPGRVRLSILLAAFAGLRVSEIARLSSGDVWLHTEPPVIIVRSGKGGRDRAVPLHPLLVAELRRTPPLGGSVQAETVSRWISAHLRALGIDATPHALRHSFGTAAARAAKGDVLAVQHLMGHADPATTLGYVQLSPVEGADIVRRLYAVNDEAPPAGVSRRGA